MTWVVVTQDALDRWIATDPDPDLVLSVLSWVFGLQVHGPPPDGVFDPFRDTFFAAAGKTRVWIEYLVLPYLVDPAIVIREYR